MFFFSSRRRHTRYWRDWSSDVCSSDLMLARTDPAVAELVWQTLDRMVATDPDDTGGLVAPQPGSLEVGEGKRGGEGERGELGGSRVFQKNNSTSARLRPPLFTNSRDLS